MRADREAVSIELALSAPKRTDELRRGVRLEVFTIAWNVLEAVIGIAAGVISGSISLIGFGLDSVVETSSGGILLWRLRAEERGGRPSEDVERRAIRLVAIAFLALAAYVGVQAVGRLIAGSRPDTSVVGIALAAVSLVVMPLLARKKKAAAKNLDSGSLQADSKQTMLCVYLSAAVLVGLLADALLGWWWADPVAALVISGMAAREGVELWRTDDLCCR